MGSARGSQPDLQCERAVARPREHALMRTAPCSLFLLPCFRLPFSSQFLPLPSACLPWSPLHAWGASRFVTPSPCRKVLRVVGLKTAISRPSMQGAWHFAWKASNHRFQGLPCEEPQQSAGDHLRPVLCPCQGSARSRPQNCHFAAFHARCLALCLESVQSPVSRPSVRGTSTVPRRSPSPDAVPVSRFCA